MENQIVKFEASTEYGAVCTAAKKFGLTYIGVKKPALIEMVNDHIDRINNGEAEIVVEEAPVQENSTAATGTEGPGEATSVATVSKANSTPRTPATPRVKGAKWYETTAPRYQEGDIVDIIAGPSLIGRQAQITRPSAKKDAMKCLLINPKDGTLQGTEITMDYFKLKLANATAPAVKDNEPVVAEDATEQTA